MHSPLPASVEASAGAVVSQQRRATCEQILLAAAQTGLLAVQANLIHYANPAAEELFGCAPGTLIGRELSSLIAAQDREHVRIQAQLRRAGHPGMPYPVQAIRADGSLIDLRICGRMIDFDGAPSILVTLVDVSELTQALARARWNAALLERSELLTGSGSFELEWPAGTLRASTGLRALTGPIRWTEETIDALPWVPEDERALVATIWRSAAPGEPFEFQHRLVGADGSRRIVLHRGMLASPATPGGPTRGQAILQDITVQREAEQRIQELANFDELTGLPNRASLLDRIDAAIHMARWDEREFAVLVIDVPRIAEIKSKMGFGAGDALAMALAARLRQACADDEFMAHLGGAEFAALLPVVPGTSVSTLRQRALSLQAVLQGSVHLGGTEVFPVAEVGIAIHPADADSPSALLEAAQTAATDARNSGGVGFFRHSVNAPAVRELQLHAALRHAIERKELRLAYQPQLSLSTGRIVGVEALLRWDHPEFGAVPPVEFIALAERTGLIGAIGDWVFRQACAQSVAWQRAGLPWLRIGINVSPLQFHEGDLARQLQAALLDTGADPHRIGIELTESALMSDVDRAIRMLNELKAIGIEISLDDFGTGFSSLNNLSRLPIDIVKIDRSFVHDVTASPENVSVTRAIITMAHSLQLCVLAEGVETDGELGLLSANGCDQIQGYWYSRPVPPDELARLVTEGAPLPERFLRRGKAQRTLLLVDDEDNIVSSLKRLLRRDGYEIITARSGAEGLQCLAERAVDVIISDQRMPGMSGVEFLRRAKALYPQTIRMTLSGFTDLQSIIDAVNEGAIYKFLTKPWEDDRLRAHVAEAFHQKELADENRRLAEQVHAAKVELEAVNERLAITLQDKQAHSDLLAASATGARNLLDHLPAAVLGLDVHNTLVYANQAAMQLLPESVDRLGTPVADWLGSELGEHDLCAAHAHGQVRRVCVQGQWFQLMVQDLPDDYGEGDVGTEAPKRGRLLMLTPVDLG